MHKAVNQKSDMMVNSSRRVQSKKQAIFHHSSYCSNDPETYYKDTFEIVTSCDRHTKVAYLLKYYIKAIAIKIIQHLST